MKKSLIATVVPALLSVTSLAAAQYGGQAQYGTTTGGSASGWSPTLPPNNTGNVDNIGSEQQFVFGVDRVMGVGFENRSVDSADGKTTTDTSGTALGLLAPTTLTGLGTPRFALDFFVIDGLSLGAGLGYFSLSSEVESKSGAVTSKTDGPTTHGLIFAPRVGYAIAFDDTFGVWPRAGLTILSGGTSQTYTDGTGAEKSIDLSMSATNLTLEAPVFISPIEHVAILVGPFWDVPLGGSTDSPKGADGSTESLDTTIRSIGLTAGFVGYY